MALNRKYAALPDLDSAPDIYETPDLTDDNSTLPTGTVRSHSAASSYKDFDEEDDDSTGISRSRLHPSEARSRFSPAQIDARDVDFSDRVTGKRKSYKASTRRQRKREAGTEKLSVDFSDDEDVESLEGKMARLRREIEEVKEEVTQRSSERQSAEGKDNGQENGGDATEDDAAKLSKMLDSLFIGGSKIDTAGSRLAKALSSGPPSSSPFSSTMPQKVGESTTYTVTYSPNFEQSHALAKTANFDSRLLLLEKALGINSIAVPALDSKAVPIAILPTLDALQRQISVLSESSPSSLDGIARRVRTLTQEAERLTEARKSAKLAQDELEKSGGDLKATDGSELGDSEQAAKISALYGTLAIIENLSPLLPSLLDRLRSLRAIHGDAAIASQNMERVAKRQDYMEGEIKRWRQGLEKVEEAVKEGEKTMGGNMKVVEGWVKELEQKMATFGN